MRRPAQDGEAQSSPATHPPSPGSPLPADARPRVAAYAHGPFLDPALVTPSAWKWRNARTYIVQHSDGHDYRAVRVTSLSGEFLGYWAVELLGVPLTLKG